MQRKAFGTAHSCELHHTSRDRTEKVHVDGYTSPYIPLKYGVQQGSILKPLPFIMCTGELQHIINAHGLLSYCYADDSQLSFFCNPSETESLTSRVISCFDDVFNWISSNRLKVNPTEPEFMWAATSGRQHFIPRGPISFSGVDIIPSRCVKLLGIYATRRHRPGTRLCPCGGCHAVDQ